MMIAVGIILTIMRVTPIVYKGTEYFLEDNIFGLISRAILVLGGLVMIVMRKKGSYFSVGIYALTLGVSRILRSIPEFASDSDIEFYAALVFFVIGVNLAYGGYNHLTVRTRDPKGMRWTALLLLVIFTLALGYFAYRGQDIIPFLLDDINIIGYLPLYAGLLIILYGREVNEGNPIGRIADFMSSLSASIYVGDSITITEDDAKVIEEGFSGASSWNVQTIGDVTVRESSIVFHTHNGDKDVILQRWSDSDNLYLSLINDKTDSFVGGQRISATGCVREDGLIEITDSDGICITMNVEGYQ